MIFILILLLTSVAVASSASVRCDQKPPHAKVLEPRENKNVPYRLRIESKANDETLKYMAGQTYVLMLESLDPSRPFQEFKLTAEDPDVDDSTYELQHNNVDVGILKTLDIDKSKYSDTCYSTIESTDQSDKLYIQTHWVSPKISKNKEQMIRFRAMVAENEEVWFTGENLTITLKNDDSTARDLPPLVPIDVCNLCSEARYEMIFTGQWSRGTHPYRYPNKPDENKYSVIVGASHDFGYIMWKRGTPANQGLKSLAESADPTDLENEVIGNMSITNGTRTLIRAKERKHPYMSEPSHALFRVDRVHHLFSIAVAIKPSPDWFLGTSSFELCSDSGWLEYSEIPLYPWDAGTANGVSYESETSVTLPTDIVERVEVGSFDRESPFYQTNLNDLKEFANLQVRLLDVYPLQGAECSEDQKTTETEEDEKTGEEQSNDEPLVAESRQDVSEKCLSEWSSWSACSPDQGSCGGGTKVRVRYMEERDLYTEDTNNLQVKPLKKCERNQDSSMVETQWCYTNC